MSDEKITSARISMKTRITIEALKKEGYFVKSASFDDIVGELADFYRQNKKNIDDKIQFLQSQITALDQKISFVEKKREKDNEMLVGLKAELGKMKKES